MNIPGYMPEFGGDVIKNPIEGGVIFERFAGDEKKLQTLSRLAGTNCTNSNLRIV
jgi:hypothetical protein